MIMWNGENITKNIHNEKFILLIKIGLRYGIIRNEQTQNLNNYHYYNIFNVALTFLKLYYVYVYHMEFNFKNLNNETSFLSGIRWE